MTKPHHREKRTRRRLLGALTFAGGTLAAKGLPERWTRPAVEAVVLPAHAQISPDGDGGGGAGVRFTCSEQGSGEIPAGGSGTVLMTISPSPGGIIPIQAMTTCNGTVIADVTADFDFSTGSATATVTAPSPPCAAGDTLEVELTAPTQGGASASCTFDIT